MTRRRIGLLVTLMLAILVARLAAAQPPAQIPRIGFLSPGSPPTAPDWRERSPFLQRLHELGWVEGHTMAVEYRWAAGQGEQLPELAAELVRLPVDVLVAVGAAATMAAQQATRTTPIVMANVGNPVGAGLIASLARPGGNLTGTASSPPEIASKQLELLAEAVPQARRIVLIFGPTAPGMTAYAKENRRAGRAFGVTLHPIEVRHPRDVDTAFAQLRAEPADALYVIVDPFVAMHRGPIVDFAARHRVPALYTSRAFVEAGGLMSHGANLTHLYAQTATYVDKILKGAKPADLPVEQPMTFELVINLKTAEALGLTIPPTLLFQATEVIR
jgi:putative tryptophan/tyrosine transport system substrate-binding protein